MPSFRPTTPNDAFKLAPRLRPADVAELTAAGAPSALAALMGSLVPGGIAVTVVDDRDRPLMMFGVAPHPTEPLVGLIWALASEEAVKHRRMFLTDAPAWIEKFQRLYPILMNYTDCRNSEHHRWLRWSGFSFINKVTGPEGFPFFEFVRIRSNDV